MRNGLDMMQHMLELQGFRLISEATVRFEEKRVTVEPFVIHPHRPLTAREMLPSLLHGDKHRAPTSETLARPVPSESESWDYVFSAEWLHDTIVGDVPYVHEEARR